VPLDEVLVKAFVAVLCGADDWEVVTVIAESHERWFRKLFTLDNGIPSHDTFMHARVYVDRVPGCDVQDGRLDENVVRKHRLRHRRL